MRLLDVLEGGELDEVSCKNLARRNAEIGRIFVAELDQLSHWWVVTAQNEDGAEEKMGYMGTPETFSKFFHLS